MLPLRAATDDLRTILADVRDIPECCGRHVIEKSGVLGENGCCLDTFFPRSTPRWKLRYQP
jgi:hypothetical protein